MNEQALLYGVTVIILAGTLIVFVTQYVRTYGKKKKDDDEPGDSS